MGCVAVLLYRKSEGQPAIFGALSDGGAWAAYLFKCNEENLAEKVFEESGYLVSQGMFEELGVLRGNIRLVAVDVSSVVKSDIIGQEPFGEDAKFCKETEWVSLDEVAEAGNFVLSTLTLRVRNKWK